MLRWRSKAKRFKRRDRDSSEKFDNGRDTEDRTIEHHPEIPTDQKCTSYLHWAFRIPWRRSRLKLLSRVPKWVELRSWASSLRYQAISLLNDPIRFNEPLGKLLALLLSRRHYSKRKSQSRAEGYGYITDLKPSIEERLFEHKNHACLRSSA
ncbi:hypothetical protein KQX54_017529 [Cotesia glomerata]|uniref:Uncharacterized protein n=1 Tax=Cotesia glomerata TaxID=32391 RepID=A0AAV7II74_COTGL|nr:hypothetical protein KQX54_017529 [Cotesia glomerata]